jgi:hypothetical protein
MKQWVLKNAPKLSPKREMVIDADDSSISVGEPRQYEKCTAPESTDFKDTATVMCVDKFRQFQELGRYL